MLDDMRMGKFGEKTQLDYVRAVRNFTKYLGRSQDTVNVEDLRNYQLHLVDHGTSLTSLNSAIRLRVDYWLQIGHKKQKSQLG